MKVLNQIVDFKRKSWQIEHINKAIAFNKMLVKSMKDYLSQTLPLII